MVLEALLHVRVDQVGLVHVLLCSFPLVLTGVVVLDSLVDSLVDSSLVIRGIWDWALPLAPFDSHALGCCTRCDSLHGLVLVVLLYHFA